MRVTLPQSGHTSCTLLACSAPSRSTIPPLTFFCGFARVCRLIMFTPSTIRRWVVGMTFSTRPRLPLYFPVVTRTVSFFRIGVCSLDIFNSNAFHPTTSHRGSEAPRVFGLSISVPLCLGVSYGEGTSSLEHLPVQGNE